MSNKELNVLETCLLLSLSQWPFGEGTNMERPRSTLASVSECLNFFVQDHKTCMCRNQHVNCKFTWLDIPDIGQEKYILLYVQSLTLGNHISSLLTKTVPLTKLYLGSSEPSSQLGFHLWLLAHPCWIQF